MILNQLRIENFKKIRDVSLDLAAVNILVGPNGCGKSSIIQAIHMACCSLRQAPRVAKNKTATIDIDQLDYLPTDDYKTLAHNGEWGNKEGTPSSKITLHFKAEGEQPAQASCILRSARNAGISVKGNVPPTLTSLLRSKNEFFSAYIPGISGIPNKEEKKSKKVVMKYCSFGDSNIILRNALLLLKLQKEQHIRTIENWIKEIIGPISIEVLHDNDNDLYITCNVEVDGTVKPLELVGTGFLQLIQIFCYILLFRPGVLLIDEPDIHLHPQVQERLAGTLSKAAHDYDFKILITTHSPFVVRGASVDTNVYWIQNGCKESEDRKLVETALGWGAFGKRVVIVSEDKDTSLLRKLVSQWPKLDRQVAFLPSNGCGNLWTPEQASDIAETLGNKFKILVHRDRDSLTIDEADKLKQMYDGNNVKLWLPRESDIEAYYCKSDFLQAFLDCTINEAEDYLEEVLYQNQKPIYDQFVNQRKAHNQELHAKGGSPTNEDVWEVRKNSQLRGAKGKYVFKQLKNKIPNGLFRVEKIISESLQIEIALDLRDTLKELVAEEQ